MSKKLISQNKKEEYSCFNIVHYSFSYSNSSNATIIKMLCKSKKLVKSQSGHTEKPFADH